MVMLYCNSPWCENHRTYTNLSQLHWQKTWEDHEKKTENCPQFSQNENTFSPNFPIMFVSVYSNYSRQDHYKICKNQGKRQVGESCLNQNCFEINLIFSKVEMSRGLFSLQNCSHLALVYTHLLCSCIVCLNSVWQQWKCVLSLKSLQSPNFRN